MTGRRFTIEEIHCDGCPDECHHAFRNHGAVEDSAGVALALQAACHQRTLCGVEATDGTTGDGDEKAGEEVLFPIGHHGEGAVGKSVPNFGNGRHLDEETNHERHCHEKQREGEERIYLPNNLVNRKHRGEDVVGKDDGKPHRHVAAEFFQEKGGAIHEDRADHDEQQHGEDEHETARLPAQIFSNQLGQTHAAVAQRKHGAEEIVDRTGEDAAEHNPKIGGSTELRPHDGAEDGTRSGNVEELNHEHFPAGQGNEINAIGFQRDRCRVGGVATKDTLHETAIENIAENQKQETDGKGNHCEKVFVVFVRMRTSFVSNDRHGETVCAERLCKISNLFSVCSESRQKETPAARFVSPG